MVHARPATSRWASSRSTFSSEHCLPAGEFWTSVAGTASLSRLLTLHGLEVEALDRSPEMVARYRANVPSVPVRCEQLLDARFPVESFDGIVAWGGPVPPVGRRPSIRPRGRGGVANTRGRSLFTSGDLEGERDGLMDGVPFHHVSLGVARYSQAIVDSGMQLLTHHCDAWDNHVYLAERPTVLEATDATSRTTA